MSCHSLCCRIHFEKEGHKITHTTKQNQPVCAILERFLSVEVSGCSNFSWHVFVLLVSRLVWRSVPMSENAYSVSMFRFVKRQPVYQSRTNGHWLRCSASWVIAAWPTISTRLPIKQIVVLGRQGCCMEVFLSLSIEDVTQKFNVIILCWLN